MPLRIPPPQKKMCSRPLVAELVAPGAKRAGPLPEDTVSPAAAAAAARRERGWNAPLTDVYFYVQLGRDGSPPPRVCGTWVLPTAPRRPNVWRARPLRGWGGHSGCPRSHSSSDAHTGAGKAEVRSPRPTGTPSLPDPDLERRLRSPSPPRPSAKRRPVAP